MRIKLCSRWEGSNMEEYDINDFKFGVDYYKKETKIRHRLDGPATIYSNGDKSWYVNGEPHRIDGPAVECSDGYKEWWINGARLSKEKEAIMNLWYENGRA